MRELNVLIVGAGIGGLQSALALAADGHKVTVLESVKGFLEVHIPIYNNSLGHILHSLRSVLAFVSLRTPPD